MVLYTVKNDKYEMCVCVCVCVQWLYAMLYRCLSVRSVECCTGLFVWGMEVWEGCVCSGGSWWRFKVLGVVCVCDRVSAWVVGVWCGG